MIIIEKEVNALTGEETITEREETAAEIKARQKRETENAAIQAEAEAKATARQAILDRLGISAEEAQLLLGGN
jgi:predicted oxidoreductase